MKYASARRLAVLFILGLAACTKPAADATPDLRPVRTLVVASGQGASVTELPGEIRPRVEARVGFQVAGRIATRVVDLGQAVRKGQVMATIDATDYRNSAAAAQQQVIAAKADRDSQRADYKRFEELQRQGFISSADLERRRAARDAADARYQQADAQARVAGNQAAYATLRAPENGVVTAIDAEVGQVVAAGQSIVRVAPTAEKEVAVAVPEGRLADLKRVTDVSVRLWAGDGGVLRGRVREIAPIADAATRSFAARIALIDPPPTVALGMTATVSFRVPIPAAVIKLPLSALLKEGDGTYVWMLDPATQTVRKSRIEVATVVDNDVVPATGVKPGDTIVTAGVHLLTDGQKVKPLNSDTAAGRSPR